VIIQNKIPYFSNQINDWSRWKNKDYYFEASDQKFGHPTTYPATV